MLSSLADYLILDIGLQVPWLGGPWKSCSGLQNLEGGEIWISLSQLLQSWWISIKFPFSNVRLQRIHWGGSSSQWGWTWTTWTVSRRLKGLVLSTLSKNRLHLVDCQIVIKANIYMIYHNISIYSIRSWQTRIFKISLLAHLNIFNIHLQAVHGEQPGHCLANLPLRPLRAPPGDGLPALGRDLHQPAGKSEGDRPPCVRLLWW